MMVVIFCVYGAYSTLKKKKQVYVIYHRVTGQILEVFAKIDDEVVDIDGKRFTLLADRHSLTWWNRGIHSFFGTWVITYEFSWYSRFPHDPKNFKNVVVSPSVLKVMNNQARMGSFARGINSAASVKKSGMLQQYAPYIIAGVVLVMLFFIFKMNGQISALTKAYNALPK